MTCKTSALGSDPGPTLALSPAPTPEDRPMQNDVYVLSAGLTALTRRQETIAANLANLGTHGYRRQDSVIQLFETALDGTAADEKVLFPVPTTSIDFAPGELETTGNPLDLAIEGEGFFAVRTPRGVEFTRAGRFTRNEAGQLATSAGDPVLAEGDGVVELGTGAKVEILRDGQVSVDGQPVARVKVVDFARRDLLRRGPTGLLVAPPPAGERAVEKPGVLQGTLEGSNVQATAEMVDLIETQRSYERKSRAIQVINDAMEILLRAAQGV
jgi:flagellar basal-body rod protein FlgF